ncbi:MAG: NAD(P)H-dependent glycerol-3-phosphate dehydrogenase [Holosporaceae bacterium]|jgi:glycerol-3-phosphate dehydrogenase (NAD(P)+)|nr:NAD(P)H-dependent glycerol-3-phosphate dehydrogenase [Holosporaceae bacterium]
MVSFNKIGIIGAGSYGTALAQCFSKMAEQVLLVSDMEIITSNINDLHMNLTVLSGVSLNMNISCTNTFSYIQDSDLIFIAVPMSAVSSVFKQIKEHQIRIPMVLCSKGFDIENGRLQSDLFEEILDNDYAILSGPSFAIEIAQGLPAEVNIASKNSKLSREIAKSLSSVMFKIEAINDHIGLQVAGALKNVLAIGCGILSGLNLGNSAIAKLIVNGLREMSELAVVLGGKKETFFELGGIGDVVLTCTSKQSRNVLFGEHLAKEGNIDNWNGRLVEGVSTANVIPIFERNYNVNMKIFSEIYKVIHNKKSLFETISKII